MGQTARAAPGDGSDWAPQQRQPIGGAVVMATIRWDRIGPKRYGAPPTGHHSTEVPHHRTPGMCLIGWLTFHSLLVVGLDKFIWNRTKAWPKRSQSSLLFPCQVFMEEMTRKQPDVDKVTKTYKRKPAEVSSSLAERRGARTLWHIHHLYALRLIYFHIHFQFDLVQLFFWDQNVY